MLIFFKGGMNMQVVKLKVEKNKERYYVATDDGVPIESVLKFIKFKDNTGYARNTLKQYCWHLKLYFEYLEQRNLDFQQVTIDDLAHFVKWLQNPLQSIKIIPINNKQSSRTSSTINTIVNTLLTFYDYALRHEEYSNNISERLKKAVILPNNKFKGFLYGIAFQNKTVASNILKLKVPKNRPKVLKKEEVAIKETTRYPPSFITGPIDLSTPIILSLDIVSAFIKKPSLRHSDNRYPQPLVWYFDIAKTLLFIAAGLIPATAPADGTMPWLTYSPLPLLYLTKKHISVLSF